MATQVSAWIARHPLASYFIMAYAITWVGVSPLALSAQGTLALTFPPTLHGVGALGPVLAALFVTTISSGRAGLLEMMRRMVRWRVGALWWLLALLSPLALFGLALAIRRVLGDPWPDTGPLRDALANPEWVAGLLVGAIAYGLGEEPGWRGFALPHLQKNHGAWGATLILSLFWALWHLPFFFYRFEFRGLVTIIGFFISLFAGALWLTFLYNSTGGSILMVALWHVLWNVLNIGGMVLSDTLVAVANMLMIAVGIAVLIVGSPDRLSRAEKQTIEA